MEKVPQWRRIMWRNFYHQCKQRLQLLIHEMCLILVKRDFSIAKNQKAPSVQPLFMALNKQKTGLPSHCVRMPQGARNYPYCTLVKVGNQGVLETKPPSKVDIVSTVWTMFRPTNNWN